MFSTQGGPGAGSSGYGNFEIIGPEDMFGNARNSTWVGSPQFILALKCIFLMIMEYGFITFKII